MNDDSTSQRTDFISSRDEITEWWSGTATRRRKKGVQHCGWCGRPLEDAASAGRRRRYCGQSCRQRAYERRIAVQRGGLPEDAVVLSADEVAAIQDRLFQLRCAAEDVVTAATDGATARELRDMSEELARGAKDLEQLR